VNAPPDRPELRDGLRVQFRDTGDVWFQTWNLSLHVQATVTVLFSQKRYILHSTMKNTICLVACLLLAVYPFAGSAIRANPGLDGDLFPGKQRKKKHIYLTAFA
jgi:hypothetical protein